MDIIHMAYIIYITAEKTPPFPATGGEPSGGGVWGSLLIYIYIYIYFS